MSLKLKQKETAALCGFNILRAQVFTLLLGLTFVLLAWPKDGAAQAPQGQATAVSTVTVNYETIQHTQQAPARVSPFRVAEIRPQVTGIITKRFFEEGGMVEQGQQLYQIDPALYDAVYESAKADLLKAQAQLESLAAREERYALLVKDEAISKQEYDDARAAALEARANIAVAKAAVSSAKINLDYTKVYAPISGRIGISSVTEGALVTANQSSVMVQITQLDPVYADMQVSRERLFSLKARARDLSTVRVRLEIDGIAEPYANLGELKFADVTVDPTTSAVTLRAVFPNPEEMLYPGVFASATMLLDKEEVLMIPQGAGIRQPNGSLAVWVVNKDNNTVSSVPVVASGVHGNRWIITQGLKAGDQVVVEGLQRLHEGVQVEVTPIQSPMFAGILGE